MKVKLNFSSNTLDMNASLMDDNATANVTMVTQGPSALKIASDVVITTTLIFIMLGMGSTIEIKELIKHLRRPIGAGIGMLAQFIVLPLATFGFAHALQMEPLAAIGMLVMGCCPGGSTSNVFTYWSDGDVPLSLTMTTVSTVLALGMMPLNVWLYSHSWTDDTLVIPYVNILISLAMTVTPAAVGIFIRWKWEKIAMYIIKVGSYCGTFAVVLTMVLISLLYPFMYKASLKIYVGSFFLPFVGFVFGYVVAIIFRMDQKRARTVALETGIQNFPLCMTLISLSFPRKLIPSLALFPLLYGVFVLTNSCLFVLIYKVIQRLQGSEKKQEIQFVTVPTNELSIQAKC